MYKALHLQPCLFLMNILSCIIDHCLHLSTKTGRNVKYALSLTPFKCVLYCIKYTIVSQSLEAQLNINISGSPGLPPVLV